MARKESFEIKIDGKKVTLRDLQSVMPGAKALIINRILYYSITKKFIVCDDDGSLYIRKSLREWALELERWYENGKKQCVSKSCVSKVFSDLTKDGLLLKLEDNDSRIGAYRIDLDNLRKCLKHLFSDVHFRCTFDGKSEHFGRKIADSRKPNYNGIPTKLQRNSDEIPSKVDIKTQAEQGLDGNFGTGTYTNTYTYTNNKSHKSEENDICKNHPMQNDFQDNKSHKSDKSISEKGNFIKNNKKDSELLQQSDQQNNPDDASNEKFACKKESSCSKQKSTIVQDMFAIWQDEFPLLEEQLSLEKSRWLKSAHDSVFNKDLEEFRTYLRRVKTSKFIIEKQHLLNMKWLLDFGNISEIRSGSYNTCDPDNPSAEWRNLKIDCEERIGWKRFSYACSTACLRMLSKLGPHLYMQWFGSLNIEVDYDSGELNCTDFYYNKKPNATRYINTVQQEIQAEENAMYEQIKVRNIEVNTARIPDDDFVKIDINHFCKPRTVNPRPPAKPEEIQIVPGVAEKMMEIWNGSIKEKYRENLTDEKVKLMNETFVNSFNEDYGQMKEYMKTLEKTVLYRTRPCMLSILWILDAETIRKVRGGFFEFAEIAKVA